MPALNDDGKARFKPIVTMLTEALVKDFTAAYSHVEDSLWKRTDAEGQSVVVTEEQLRKDVHSWLLGLEDEMEDKQFAKMCMHMIRSNPGWTTLLSNRVIKRLS